MMREIKFRMWDTKANKYFIDQEIVIECLKQQLTDTFDHIANGSVFEEYTGLKDKKGVEIFEGDLVISTYGKWALEKKGLTRSGVIVFDSGIGAFRFKINDSKITVSFNDISKIEVIGNIHENPELLEVAK